MGGNSHAHLQLADTAISPFRAKPAARRYSLGIPFMVVSRKRINKHLRVQILARDGYRCRMCGRTQEVVALHIDHVVALADGGTDEESNLATLCAECNLGKAAYRFRDYRDIHCAPRPIPLDRPSLFAYVNAHSRPASIAQRIATRRMLAFRNIDSDCAWLFEQAQRLGIRTVRALDDMVAKHGSLADRLSDYPIPRQPVDAGFVLARILEIEAMERNGLDGLEELLGSLKLTSADAGWRVELFHAYQQIKIAD